jgi:cytochrome c oxidase assembly protein subunit 15
MSFAVLLALIVIVLGAYTRLSDSDLGCPDWPGCYGHLTVSEDDSTEVFPRPFIHRVVALIVFIYFSVFSFKLIKRDEFKKAGFILLVVLISQVTLGIMNVVLGLPLLVAVLHNLTAAILLLTIIAINHRAFKSR